MRIFALELNNGIKGILERKRYIETLIAQKYHTYIGICYLDKEKRVK